MRVNLIDPIFLLDQHLIAEKRELRMIPALLEKRSKKSPVIDYIPERFCLGTGHQKFWLDKFLYLEKRFNSLVDEMKRRGFHPDPEIKFAVDLAKHYGLYNDWEPEPEDYNMIEASIRERVMAKLGWYRYYGKPVDEKWLNIIYPTPILSEEILC